jgi:hypothetical protein
LMVVIVDFGSHATVRQNHQHQVKWVADIDGRV